MTDKKQDPPDPLTTNQKEAVAEEKKQGYKLSAKDVKPTAEELSSSFEEFPESPKLSNEDVANLRESFENPEQGAEAKQEAPRQAESAQFQQKSAPSYAKKSPIFTGLRSLREKIFGSRKASAQEAQTREDLIKVSNQMVVTESIIQENTVTLSEVAKHNVELASILSHLKAPRQAELREKTLSGAQLYPEELKEIVSYLKNVTSGIDKVGVKLSISLSKIIQDVEKIVLNPKQSISNRRAVVQNLVAVLEKNKIAPQSLLDLKKLSSEQLNFTEEDNKTLSSILGTLKDDTIDKKIYGTMKEMSDKFDSLLLNEDELRKFLERKDDTDKTNEQNLLQKGLGAVGPGIKTGLLDTLFAAIGLPGLGSVLSGLGIDPLALLGKGGSLLAKGAFGGAGLLAKGVGTFAGAAGEVGTGLAGGAETAALIPAATAVATGLLATAAGAGLGYLAVQGLDKITGGKYSQIIGAPGAWLSDQVGKVTGGAFGSISDEEAFKQGAAQVAAQKAKMGIATPTSLPKAISQSQPTEINSQVLPLATKQGQEDRTNQQKAANKPAQPVVIQQPSIAKESPLAPQRRTAVDDAGLAIMNSVLFE